MKDIAERLRIHIHTSADETALTNEAADEIERLREALKRIVEDTDGTDPWQIAENALQQKESK